MSEAREIVSGVNELPLFPLSVVLFPGLPLPLHIFESRYRQMLTDIQAGNSLFGLSYFDPTTSEGECPEVGSVGCVAKLTDVQLLPDGRSNILVYGVIRYLIEEYVDHGTPYFVARVSYFEDEDEDKQALKTISLTVAEEFGRIARAVRTINNERAALPDIAGTEPERLSYMVALAMDVDAEAKQELLELSSTTERLEQLHEILNEALPGYEERARVHELAKGNGHSGKKIDLD
jgi:Lon protease-like protein